MHTHIYMKKLQIQPGIEHGPSMTPIAGVNHYTRRDKICDIPTAPKAAWVMLSIINVTTSCTMVNDQHLILYKHSSTVHLMHACFSYYMHDFYHVLE